MMERAEEIATFRIETAAPAETEAFGAALGALLSGGMVVTLAGELGAGKTVFIRGIARGLKIPAGVLVTSPTYVLQHRYEGGRLTVYHIDAYRLRGGADEFEASGLKECFDDPAGVVCLEWPERTGNVPWVADKLEVQLEHVDACHRSVEIRAIGSRPSEILKELRLVY
jgi:tRNA threonylcarbamoyladenosine biosynthesis protein TsaE